MPTDIYTRAIQILSDNSAQRVWSMVVTVFGDLAQDEGDGIDGPVLTEVMADIGIKPEATRVALYRLRNDGWISSAKSGRTSRHSLTPTGRKQSIAASDIIYRPISETAQDWQMILLETATSEDREAMRKRGFAPLAPRLFIGAALATPPKNGLVLNAHQAPNWLCAQFEPKDLSQDYAALFEKLTAVAALNIDESDLGPRQIGVLRCLIVHGWRRLVLKHPDLPRGVYTDAWRGHDCRQLVMTLLEGLPRPTVEALHQ